MKPAPFRYHRPATEAEALALLAEHGDEAKVLAGGQSLLPMLSMRLAAPAHLVDVGALPGLDRIEVGAEAVRVGALVRHADLEHDPAVHAVLPVVHDALRHVGHPAIRNRGTTVGSICHADPAGEMPAVAALLGAVVVARSVAGERRLAAGGFFTGPLESALRPDELAVAVEFPVPPAGTRTSVAEVARRSGDYAVCGVIAAVHAGGARAAYVSMGPTPPVLDLTAALAAGPAAAAEYARAHLDPEGDVHATAEYRRHLAGVLTARALRGLGGSVAA